MIRKAGLDVIPLAVSEVAKLDAGLSCMSLRWREDGVIASKIVTVNDRMQRHYRYKHTEPSGRNFDLEFRPQLTPKEMRKM